MLDKLDKKFRCESLTEIYQISLEQSVNSHGLSWKVLAYVIESSSALQNTDMLTCKLIERGNLNMGHNVCYQIIIIWELSSIPMLTLALQSVFLLFIYIVILVLGAIKCMLVVYIWASVIIVLGAVKCPLYVDVTCICNHSPWC